MCFLFQRSIQVLDSLFIVLLNENAEYKIVFDRWIHLVRVVIHALAKSHAVDLVNF